MIKIDIEIVYEHVERELNNAYLLKFELEKRGYEVKISPAFEPKLPSLKAPKLLITPWLHDDKGVNGLKFKYLSRVNKILNLQYEHVISQVWLESGAHCPSGLAKNGIHICWGDKIRRRLLKNGIQEKNLKIINDMKFDFESWPKFNFF